MAERAGRAGAGRKPAPCDGAIRTGGEAARGGGAVGVNIAVGCLDRGAAGDAPARGDAIGPGGEALRPAVPCATVVPLGP